MYRVFLYANTSDSRDNIDYEFHFDFDNVEKAVDFMKICNENYFTEMCLIEK